MQRLQHEKTTNSTSINMKLEKITLSSERTYHLYNKVPFYNKKFIIVEKFHQPGLAPVLDNSGAYHIDISGNEAYANRFNQSFGFYCGYASIEKNKNWFHILPSGKRAYRHNYDWLGNFQEDICVAKKDGVFFHINSEGEKLYKQKYNYVGDFKDGYAVVYLDGESTHINVAGEYLHNKWFKRLSNFHKNYACAEDNNGWFHINMNGIELYQERYKNIEPFYNKQALVESLDGRIKQINMNNMITHEVISSLSNQIYNINELYSDLVGFWKTKLISIAVKLNLFESLSKKTTEISTTLGIPVKNLLRLLRALWELDIVEYDLQNDFWYLAAKGKLFLTERYDFLSSAAIMWDKVSSLNWDKLLLLLKQEEISSFKSFKDQEPNEEVKHIYQTAIDGYLKIDLEKIVNKLIKIDNPQNILCIGRSASLLADSLNDLCSVNIETKSNLEQLRELPDNKNYEYAIALKFIHYFDDQKAEEIISLISKAGVKEIIFIEMLVSKDKSTGGILDINMLIECGGKLRNIVDYSLLLNKRHYKIYKVQEINPFLHMIYARI